MADPQANTGLEEVLNMLAKCCKCGQNPKHIMGKLLPCGHVMCISCLQQLETSLRSHEVDDGAMKAPVSDENIRECQEKPKNKPIILSCPCCLKSFHAQNTGLSNLQSLNLDFGIINHLVRTNTICKKDCQNLPGESAQHFCYECNAWMCGDCSPRHCSADRSLHHVVTTDEYNKTFSESFERCPTHSERATMFCTERTCQIPVCLMCLSISHAGHKAVSFEDASALIRERLSSLRKANKRRQESLRDNRQKLTMKLSDECRKFSETKEQIELRMEELRHKLESMRSQVTEKGEQSMETVNGDSIVANLVDKLLKSAMQQDTSTNVLLGVSRMIKSNRQWFPMINYGPNGPEFYDSSTLTVAGIVDPINDIMSTISSDPCYKALLEPPRILRSPSASMLRSLHASDEVKKYTLANHFVPDEIASYLSKPGEELSQLSVKHTTTLANNDLGLLVGFYSSAFGWENGILVLSCRNANKTFKCKRAFSVRYQKHTYIKIAGFGSSHLMLADDTNRCVVTYTLNGKEVSTFSFSPNEVPRHIEIMDNKLIVTFRHEIKTFMINICGDMDGQHRVVFVLYNNLRGFEKENVMLEDAHVSEDGQLFVRGFIYPENTNRVREDPVFLNYRLYIIDENHRSASSRKVQYNSCADMYGVGSIALSPNGRYMFTADYNQNAVLEIPIKRVAKRTTIDVGRSSCLLSNLDGIEKLKTVAVDRNGDLVIVQAKDVKLFRKV
ncbi:uncharacterized protein LOC135497909 [Lineus longissimus]|uniref:uncharacterized protein LOC135497909 n=1 Tax=Lineus longissimus TaxID=88925 RepID=UPI00315C604B